MFPIRAGANVAEPQRPLVAFRLPTVKSARRISTGCDSTVEKIVALTAKDIAPNAMCELELLLGLLETGIDARKLWQPLPVCIAHEAANVRLSPREDI